MRTGTHSVHVDAVGVGPGVLEILLQPLPEWVGDLVEADKFPDSQHLGVVAGGARVQPLDDGRHVPEDAGIHEGWRREEFESERRKGEQQVRKTQQTVWT